MTLLEKYNKENPLLGTYEKDGFTLEIREKNYFILLKNGKVTHKGVRLDNELKTYFGVN
tara:strand:+ start:68 stop:244 length:177 start_codon:yes stop_codon:yes gene_type:complete